MHVLLRRGTVRRGESACALLTAWAKAASEPLGARHWWSRSASMPLGGAAMSSRQGPRSRARGASPGAGGNAARSEFPLKLVAACQLAGPAAAEPGADAAAPHGVGVAHGMSLSW